MSGCADTLERQIALTQLDAARAVLADESHVFVQDAALKLGDVSDDRPQRAEKLRIGSGMCGVEFFLRDAHRGERQFFLVELRRVLQHGGKPTFTHVGSVSRSDSANRH